MGRIIRVKNIISGELIISYSSRQMLSKENSIALLNAAFHALNAIGKIYLNTGHRNSLFPHIMSMIKGRNRMYRDRLDSSEVLY